MSAHMGFFHALNASGVVFLVGYTESVVQLRRVLDQIRGRTYEEALMILEFMPYRACEPILQTLISV
jgi:Ribosomal protein L22p/L17e